MIKIRLIQSKNYYICSLFRISLNKNKKLKWLQHCFILFLIIVISTWIQLKRRQNVAKNIKRKGNSIVEIAQNSEAYFTFLIQFSQFCHCSNFRSINKQRSADYIQVVSSKIIFKILISSFNQQKIIGINRCQLSKPFIS